MIESWGERSWNSVCIQYFLIENYQEIQIALISSLLGCALCNTACKRDGCTWYDVEGWRNFWSREATLMLLYFISSYFSSSSLVSLGRRDIHTFSLDTFLGSGWCKRVPIVYKLQIFSCVVDIPLPKNVFSYFACASVQRQFSFDNEYSVFHSWLGFGVVEECLLLPLIP